VSKLTGGMVCSVDPARGPAIRAYRTPDWEFPDQTDPRRLVRLRVRRREFAPEGNEGRAVARQDGCVKL